MEPRAPRFFRVALVSRSRLRLARPMVRRSFFAALVAALRASPAWSPGAPGGCLSLFPLLSQFPSAIVAADHCQLSTAMIYSNDIYTNIRN